MSRQLDNYSMTSLTSKEAARARMKAIPDARTMVHILEEDRHGAKGMVEQWWKRALSPRQKSWLSDLLGDISRKGYIRNHKYKFFVRSLLDDEYNDEYDVVVFGKDGMTVSELMEASDVDEKKDDDEFELRIRTLTPLPQVKVHVDITPEHDDDW